MAMLDAAFWKDKRVLVTGHTGFKGSWLVLWLRQMGARVYGVALPPVTTPNLFNLAKVSEGIESHFCDIRDAKHLTALVQEIKPEMVFHLAAQALVRPSYRDPLSTFSANVMGTAHLLDALSGLESVRVALMITTDKVYQNLEHPYPYRETDALGGRDPYSASKAASELVIASYRDSFLREQGVAVASARAGNVIGGGDWSEDRLIPDAIRAWQADTVLNVRHPEATRPWQHVLEPLYGYLSLAEKLWYHPELSDSYNFGPHTHEAATVRQVLDLAHQVYGSGAIRYGEPPTEELHEAGWLALETVKARVVLGVTACWSLDEAVKRTINWYRAQNDGVDAQALCLKELADYQVSLSVRGVQ